MKNLVKLFGITILSVFTLACGEKFTGQIELEGMSQLSVRDSGGSNRLLHSGPATVQIEEEGTFLDSVLKIKTGKETFKFKIPKEAYAEALNFRVSAQTIGQNFGVTGSYHEEVTGTHSEVHPENCDYVGYCCQIDPEEGINSCLFRAGCDGKQDVRVDIQSFNKFFQVSFVDEGSGKQLGHFESDPKKDTRIINKTTIGTCE